MTAPQLGSIVQYRLTDADAAAINGNRVSMTQARTVVQGNRENIGNAVKAGDVFPAMVVRTWGPDSTTVQLQVFLDGNDTYWATSRGKADAEVAEGRWDYPALLPAKDPAAT